VIGIDARQLAQQLLTVPPLGERTVDLPSPHSVSPHGRGDDPGAAQC
jgi:hypothetical protein